MKHHKQCPLGTSLKTQGSSEALTLAQPHFPSKGQEWPAREGVRNRRWEEEGQGRLVLRGGPCPPRSLHGGGKTLLWPAQGAGVPAPSPWYIGIISFFKICI